MKWLNCVKTIATKDKVGKCPYCNGTNTDFSYVIVHEKMGYLDVWCNDCKKMGHISRSYINLNSKNVINIKDVDKVIPKYEITY